MPFDRIDIAHLRRDLLTLAAQCLALKQALRKPWVEPMAEAQQRLCRLRRRATELHVLSALRRGRLHVISPPRDLPPAAEAWDKQAWNARVAERAALDYALPSEAAEVATP
jgi:hypothetical protein